MAELLEFQPTDDSMMIFDGTILEILAGGISERFHVKGIEDVEIIEKGLRKGITVTNRFGSDVGITYDKERLPEVREFVDRVLAEAQGA